MGGLLHLVQQGGIGRRRSPPRPLLAVPNVAVHPSTATAVYQLRIIRCSTIIVFGVWRVNNLFFGQYQISRILRMWPFKQSDFTFWTTVYVLRGRSCYMKTIECTVCTLTGSSWLNTLREMDNVYKWKAVGVRQQKYRNSSSDESNHDVFLPCK